MDIKFHRRLRKNFNSAGALKRAYGERMAKAITDRIEFLQEAQNLALALTSLPGRMHPLRDDRNGQYAVDLVHPYRLVFEPDHTSLPRTEDGVVDAGQVTAIVIVEVVNYH